MGQKKSEMSSTSDCETFLQHVCFGSIYPQCQALNPKCTLFCSLLNVLRFAVVGGTANLIRIRGSLLIHKRSKRRGGIFFNQKGWCECALQLTKLNLLFWLYITLVSGTEMVSSLTEQCAAVTDI